MPKKTISREDFFAKASVMKVDLDGFPVLADPREFASGSFGWFANGKAIVTVDGKPVAVHVGLNVTVVGSKDRQNG